MDKFKVGDKIRMFNTCSGGQAGEIYTLEQNGDYLAIKCPSSPYVACTCQYNWELITNNKTMNLKEKFITAFLSEPEKSFRKAGITNGDGLLTEDGLNVFLSYLLKKEGTTFKTEVVDVLLAEEAKTCK